MVPPCFTPRGSTRLVFPTPTFAIRAVAGVAGLLSVLLMLRLRRSIGSIGALAAASLLAVSPGAVYFSRYFIHEMLLVCFTIGLVAAAVAWRHSRRETSLYMAALSAGLMFATKETAFISAFVLAAAMFGAAWIVEARFNARAEQPVTPPWQRAFLRRALRDVLDPHDHGRRQVAGWLIAAAIVLGVNVLFYTSFFAHPEGAIDAIRALALWTGTGTSDHIHASYTYLAWLTQEEMPLLILGTAGAVLALWKADNQFAVFAALWSIGILAAYSIIPYKTPWLTLNIIAPLTICGGYAADFAWRHRAATRRGVVAGAATALLLLSTYQAVALSFVRYDDNSNPYVYAHTSRDVLALVAEVQRLGEHNRDMTIAVTAKSQFPLSWYLRSYASRVPTASLFSPTIRSSSAAATSNRHSTACWAIGTPKSAGIDCDKASDWSCTVAAIWSDSILPIPSRTQLTSERRMRLRIGPPLVCLILGLTRAVWLSAQLSTLNATEVGFLLLADIPVLGALMLLLWLEAALAKPWRFVALVFAVLLTVIYVADFASVMALNARLQLEDIRRFGVEWWLLPAFLDFRSGAVLATLIAAFFCPSARLRRLGAHRCHRGNLPLDLAPMAVRQGAISPHLHKSHGIRAWPWSRSLGAQKSADAPVHRR